MINKLMGAALCALVVATPMPANAETRSLACWDRKSFDALNEAVDKNQWPEVVRLYLVRLITKECWKPSSSELQAPGTVVGRKNNIRDPNTGRTANAILVAKRYPEGQTYYVASEQ